VLQSLHLAIPSLVHKNEKQGTNTFFPEKPIFQMLSEVKLFLVRIPELDDLTVFAMHVKAKQEC
jgi:hypothetical protein